MDGAEVLTMKVMTTKGPIEWDQLFINDVVQTTDNARKVATEYHLKGKPCPPECGQLHDSPDCRLVRRDVAVSMLMPPTQTETTIGELN
jgi:hypothetical protein